MLARLVTLLLGVAAGCALPLAGHAQYPNKPVHIVVQFPAGGLADTVIRALAVPMQQSLGQTVIVDNKPGADGAIAGEAVKNSAPDGYTLFFATNSALSAAPVLHSKTPYDPIRDFTPISLVGRFPFFVYAHPSLQSKSLRELVAQARDHPGKMNYGTGNTTSILATAQLAALGKLQMVQVPYKGDAPLMADLVAGRLHFAIASTAPGAGLAKDGKLRVLATLLERRSPLFPDAPTLVESGFPQYALVPWGAMVGPAGLPPEVVERIHKETNAAMRDAKVKETLDRFGYELQGSTPEELAKFMREQLEGWRQGVKDAGIPTD